METLHYGRHFVLLAGMTAVLALSRGSLVTGVAATFGFYGVLHSTAIAVTLRNPAPLARRLIFIAMGGALSWLCATVGLYGARLIGPLPRILGPALLLAATASLGAASDGMLVRRCFAPDLSCRALAWIALGCAAATEVVLLSRLYLRAGALAFAAFWWFAFSIGFRHQDRRRPSGP